MKKIMILLTVAVMILCLTTSVFAAGGFTESPSSVSAPVLVEYEAKDPSCGASLFLCAYANRAILADDERAVLEAAYASIAGASDLGGLNAGIGDVAKALRITSAQLAVSDLFALTMSGCETHDAHGEIAVIIQPRVLENFAGLMYFDGAKWHLVEECEVSADGTKLIFDAVEMGPYAILVHDGSGVVPGADGVNWLLAAAIAAAVAVGFTFFFIILFKKKKKDDEEKAA